LTRTSDSAGTSWRPHHPVPRSLIVLLIALISWAGCQRPISSSAGGLHSDRQAAIQALDREAAGNSGNERYRALVRGLRWCAAFNENDQRFDFTFSNYLTMLDELTLTRLHPALEQIVHGLIVQEFARAVPRLQKLFPADADGYGDFISILPVAYHHQVPIGPLQRFAGRHFAGIALPDRLQEFHRAAKERNYDALTTLIVEATFIDLADRMGASADFRMPPNNYQTFLEEAAEIPFVHGPGEDGYGDQNYYATHLVLALNHYGYHPLPVSAADDHVFRYLSGHYNAVRNQADDLDLLCEYLYCLRTFARENGGSVAEGERHVLSRQNADGSWGTADDFNGDPYDQLHPTWTAITLLVQGE